MNRKDTNPIHFTKSLILALLIVFPPVYQAFHSAFLHQHHVGCSEHNESILLQHHETCQVINFVFYTQTFAETGPAIAKPVELRGVVNIELLMPPVTEAKVILIPRAPPFSC